MSAQSSDLLTQAYDLIEADRLDEAAAILKPILETEKDNPDVWWLYSHAVTDVETARLALNNVLRLDSSYPEAAELLQQLESRSPAGMIADSGNGEPTFLPGIAPIPPKDLPGLSVPKSELADDEFPDDEEEDADESEGLSRWGMVAAIAIGLLLIAALVYVVARPFSGPSSPSTPMTTAIPTLSVAESQTLPTEAPPPTLETTFTTDQPAQPSSFVSFDADLRSAMSSFTVTEDGIAISDTSLGRTLLVNICTSAGAPLRETMPASMDALARANGIYAAEALDAIGVRMIDCAINEPLRSIGTAITNAVSFANGSLSSREFQSTWVPVR